MEIFVTVLGENLFGSDDKNIIKKQFARIHDIVVIPTFGQKGIPFFIYDSPGHVPFLRYDVLWVIVFILLWLVA